MDNRYLFTSESVTEGHPDKLCDRIADGILDAYLRRDPTARVACEVTAARGMITVMGQITSCAVVDIQTIVRHVVRETGGRLRCCDISRPAVGGYQRGGQLLPGKAYAGLFFRYRKSS